MDDSAYTLVAERAIQWQDQAEAPAHGRPGVILVVAGASIDFATAYSSLAQTTGASIHCCRSLWEALSMAPGLVPGWIVFDAAVPVQQGLATLAALRRLAALSQLRAILVVPTDTAALSPASWPDGVLAVPGRQCDPHDLIGHIGRLCVTLQQESAAR